MSKYDPLKEYLMKRATVELTYEKIEEIIGAKLPESAYNNCRLSFWRNEAFKHDPKSPQVNAWYDAGWSILEVKDKSVIFIRHSS